MAWTFKSQGIYSENEGAKLLTNHVAEIISENVFAAGLDPVAEELGYEMVSVEKYDGEFTSMLGAVGLQEVGEFDELPIINKEQGYSKGYRLKRYGGAVAISKPLRKWIEANATNPTVDPTIKSELNKLKNDVTELVDSVKITKNEVATEVFTKGFAITSDFWPWAPTPDGVALFSASHVIKSTGATQSNLVTGALSQANLEAAIELLRNMKNGRGRSMKRAKVYQLIVSRNLEKTARKILNDGSNFASSDAGVALSNSITENVFTWDGFRIELVVLDTLVQPKEDGTVVGTATQWFLMNRELARQLGAFKFLTLYSEEMDMYEDKKTKVLYLDVDLSFTCDAYNYECVVGSTGV